MTQHDQVIDNATGLAVRTDINSALAALFSSSSGSVEPVVKTAGQLWFDTGSSPNLLKIRNSGNTAWVTITQMASIDMATGLRTTPDRWVVNENAALTGRDYLSVLDGSGVLQIQDTLNLLEVDGSIRGKINVGIGADAGTIICVVYDASGTEVNRWTMIPSAFRLKNGGYQLHNGTAIRAQLSADMVGATGRLNLDSYTSGGVVDGTAVLTSQGMALNTVGDFYISRSGFQRAHFGWDNTLGTYIRQKNASGVLNAELDIAPAGASLQFGDYRLVTAAGVVRGAMIAERVAAGGKLDLASYTSAGVVDGQATLAPGGFQLLFGDYHILRASVSRAQLGFDATLDSLMLKHRDAAGTVTGEAHLRDALFSLRIGSAADGVGSFALEDNAGQVRGRLTNNNNTGTIRMVNLDAAGTVISQLVAGGANLSYSPPGVPAQNVLTEVNIINPTTGQSVVDFPIGTYVLAYSATGAEPNRNVDALVRLPASGTFAYQNGGGGTQLTGTWRSRGTMIVTASPAILMQRVS